MRCPVAPLHQDLARPTGLLACQRTIEAIWRYDHTDHRQLRPCKGDATSISLFTNTKKTHIRDDEEILDCIQIQNYNVFIRAILVLCLNWTVTIIDIRGPSVTLTACLIHGYGVFLYMGDEGQAGGAAWTLEIVSWFHSCCASEKHSQLNIKI